MRRSARSRLAWSAEERNVPEWSSLDIGDILQMLQKRLRCFCHNVKHSHTCLPIHQYQHEPRQTLPDVQRTFMYSTNRLRNATKCSALRIFPGIASLIISSESTTNRISNGNREERRGDNTYRDSPSHRPLPSIHSPPVAPQQAAHTHPATCPRPFA